MGQKRKNLEVVTDLADGRHFIRLHRDILLPAAACEAVRLRLAAGRFEQAKSTTPERAPADSRKEIKLFFTSAAELLASEDRAPAASTVGSRAGGGCGG